MKLFFYKLDKSPLLFIICKLSSINEMERIEALYNNVFQILVDEKVACEENILIFSIIKDFNKTIENIILPAKNSNEELIHTCHTNNNAINIMIVELLKNVDSEFYIEIQEFKILIHNIKLNMGTLASFYSIK